jgi:hypothetical protein
MREQWTGFRSRLNIDGMANLDPHIFQNGGANLNAFIADVSFGAIPGAGNHFRNDVACLTTERTARITLAGRVCAAAGAGARAVRALVSFGSKQSAPKAQSSHLLFDESILTRIILLVAGFRWTYSDRRVRADRDSSHESSKRVQGGEPEFSVLKTQHLRASISPMPFVFRFEFCLGPSVHQRENRHSAWRISPSLTDHEPKVSQPSASSSA